MRKYIVLIVAVVAACLGIFPAYADGEIGKVTRIQGSATQALGNQTKALEAGALIRQNAVIKTGPDSRLEIVFIDGSQMRLGADAQFIMDTLVYDARSADANTIAQSFEILAGTFQFVSGAVGRQDKNAVRISTPVATIGIRGTDFFGGPLEAGMPPGQIHYGFMILGGAIDVTSVEGTVTLDEPNEGTFLPMHGKAKPTDPKTWSKEAVDEAFASIAFR